MMAEGSWQNSGQPGWNPPQHPPPATSQPSQPPHGQYPPPSQAAPQTGSSAAWWAQGAAYDPWRNPQTSAVVTHTPPPQLPPTEPPVPAEQRSSRTGWTSVIAVPAVIALLMGFLGATIAILMDRDNDATINEAGEEREFGDYQEMIRDVIPSVVTIWIDGAEGAGNGSGWVMSEEGYIVTNQHVAALADGGGAEVMVQFSDGQFTEAEVVGSATTTDIAVLEVDRDDLPALNHADSEQLAVGDPVLAMGAPLGLSETVTEGIVSAMDRPVVAGESEEDSTVMAGVQTDASINPGNSGGPLLDANGQLIGVNTSIYSFANDQGEAGSIGLGFAIPSNQATRVAGEIIDDGTPTKPVLGAELDATSIGDVGAEVDNVDSDTPAADAGIQDGDRITQMGDDYITDEIQLQALVLKHAPGDTVTVSYERDGSDNEADIELGSEEDD